MHTFLFILFIGGGTLGAILARKLTIAAGLTGAMLGTIIFISVGWIGIALMSAFFLLGTLATSWKKKLKEGYHEDIANNDNHVSYSQCWLKNFSNA